MARERYEDEDDDRDEREERGSRDDRDEERPRRRDDDYEDDYERPRRGGELTGFDKTMNSMPLTILFALVGLCCCPLIGIILGIIGMIQCKNPDSKRNSIIVLAAGVAGLVINIILQVSGVTENLMKQR